MISFKQLAAFASVLFVGIFPRAEAAPCCSGSSSTPAIITGDDRAQISASISHGTIIGDAPVEGLPVFRPLSDSETTQTFRLDGAFLLTDRLQVGAGASLLSREVANSSAHSTASRMGDVDLDVAYEFLPEWSYSPWKPRGHAFFGVTVPTGRSIYESESPGLVDASGKGFYRLQTGMILIKRLSIWDFAWVGEIHRSIPRSFSATAASPDPIRVDAGTGGSISLGAGVSPSGGNLRIGMRIQPNWNSGKIVETGGTRTESSRMQTVDTALESSYLISDKSGMTWTVFGSYVDQTLLGPARNSTLSRTLALGLQHRWNR